jgi:D-xylose 1-dehydrogenase (NADP+, D-xylono-1,5-lactone-forming)
MTHARQRGQVRWGILAAARIGETVISACRNSRLAAFVAVAARDRNRAHAYAAKLGLTGAYGSYDELLESDEVDAIYVAAPNALHMEWSTRAARAGKHVLCEKPLGRDPAAVREAFAAAERTGVVIAEAFQWRYHPQTNVLRRLVHEGAIGEVRHLASVLSFAIEGGYQRDVRASAALEGGALMDVGSYCVAASRLVLGQPEWVFGAAERKGDVDARFVGTLGFAGGATAVFDSGMTLPRRDGLEVVGDAGVLRVADPWHCRVPKIEVRRDDVVKTVPVLADGLKGDIYDAYRLEVEAVSRAIAGEGELEFGREDAVAQALTLDALTRSAESASRVDLAAES